MFDYLFITHLPSFYKVNLYNKLAEKLKIFVIFVGADSSIRTSDFSSNKMNFEYVFLSQTAFEKRYKFITLIKLIKIIIKNNYKKIVVGGWDLVEFWLVVFLSSKHKNCLALESSDSDSAVTGIKSLVKKIFLSRIFSVFASGIKQQSLLNKLGYKDKIVLTKGVGLMNYQPRILVDKIFSGNFLYVGRLSAEKNLVLLIEVFNELTEYKLTLAGVGPMLSELKQIANKNINFLGHIPNQEIAKIYSQHDALILPSSKEPWGLVVEEALYYGLPAIVSTAVGCSLDLIKDGFNGLIFDYQSKEDLKNKIINLVNDYENLKKGAEQFDLPSKDNKQLISYLNL